MSTHLIRDALAPLLYGAAAYAATRKPSQAVMPLVGGVSIEGLKAAVPAMFTAKQDLGKALESAGYLAAPALAGTAASEEDPAGALGQALGALGGGAAGLALGTKFLVPRETPSNRGFAAAIAAAIGAAAGAKLTGRSNPRKEKPVTIVDQARDEGAKQAMETLGLDKVATRVSVPGVTTSTRRTRTRRTSTTSATAPGTSPGTVTSPGTATVAPVVAGEAPAAAPAAAPQAEGGGWMQHAATWGLPLATLGYQIFSGERDRSERSRERMAAPYGANAYSQPGYF